MGKIVSLHMVKIAGKSSYHISNPKDVCIGNMHCSFHRWEHQKGRDDQHDSATRQDEQFVSVPPRKEWNDCGHLWSTTELEIFEFWKFERYPDCR